MIVIVLEDPKLQVQEIMAILYDLQKKNAIPIHTSLQISLLKQLVENQVQVHNAAK